MIYKKRKNLIFYSYKRNIIPDGEENAVTEKGTKQPGGVQVHIPVPHFGIRACKALCELVL